jgi:hypothetical protein
MPLVSYRASAEPVLRWERSDQVVPGLHKIREVAGHRQSAKQILTAPPDAECSFVFEQRPGIGARAGCHRKHRMGEVV